MGKIFQRPNNFSISQIVLDATTATVATNGMHLHMQWARARVDVLYAKLMRENDIVGSHLYGEFETLV